MELKKLKIKIPSGSEYIVDAEIEFDTKNGYQIKRISKVNNVKVDDNYVLKDLVSSSQIEEHLKSQK